MEGRGTVSILWATLVAPPNVLVRIEANGHRNI
jgi:hypothetical protein